MTWCQKKTRFFLGGGEDNVPAVLPPVAGLMNTIAMKPLFLRKVRAAFFGVGNHQTADMKVYSLSFAAQRSVDGWKQQRMKLQICSHRINGTIVYLPTFRTYKSTQPLRVR